MSFTQKNQRLVGDMLFTCLALNTGMRAGEIWGLMPKDFSRDGHSIYVVRQYNRVNKNPLVKPRVKIIGMSPE
jgi:integrase